MGFLCLCSFEFFKYISVWVFLLLLFRLSEISVQLDFWVPLLILLHSSNLVSVLVEDVLMSLGCLDEYVSNVHNTTHLSADSMFRGHRPYCDG